MASANCTLRIDGAVTTVPVSDKVHVRYEFETKTSANLALPYAVAIDGKVLPDYLLRARALGQNRFIDLMVDVGSKISLFLNSDAMPRFRRHPVYPVTVGRNDIVVTITEKTGEHPRILPDIGLPSTSCGKNGKVTETYSAWLTGDIWMLISHCYTWEEAKEMLPADVPEPIRITLERIYCGRGSSLMPIDFPANGNTPAMLMAVEVGTQNNVNGNVSSCDLGSGILPRTHPAAYVALFSAAYAVRITKLCITSAWRPMLGSIAHRAGLGLDVSFIRTATQSVSLNRASLKKATGNNENVSATEQSLYRDYIQAKRNYETRERELANARKLIKNNKDPSKLAALEADAHLNSDRFEAARTLLLESKKSWDDERDLNEPRLSRDLRQTLSKHPLVSQLLDPWYIDFNTRDSLAAASNEQITSNEFIHNNHLHITVNEPSLP